MKANGVKKDKAAFKRGLLSTGFLSEEAAEAGAKAYMDSDCPWPALIRDVDEAIQAVSDRETLARELEDMTEAEHADKL